MCSSWSCFCFSCYLSSRDSVFSFLPHLWVQQDGSLPSCSWFTCKLHQFLPHHFSGHSFRAGGATHLAAVGIPNERIQAMGCWTSEAWHSYLCKNPVILFANASPSSMFDSFLQHVWIAFVLLITLLCLCWNVPFLLLNSPFFSFTTIPPLLLSSTVIPGHPKFRSPGTCQVAWWSCFCTQVGI